LCFLNFALISPQGAPNSLHSALYYAAVQGHAVLVRLLLEHGADPTIRRVRTTLF
jgi:ankyrin repeat protein